MAKANAIDTVRTALMATRRIPPISYNEMDCQAFMEYCVNENGTPKINYRGSNDMFRNACSWVGTLAEAVTNGYLKPGVWLFIHAYDGGEPESYKRDGKGNANHVGIYTNTDGIEVVHSSASLGGVFASTLKNGWTHVGIPKDVNFDWKGGNTEMIEPTYNYPVLRKGKKNNPSDVKKLQVKLLALSYLVGKTGADGIFGSGTHNAVWQFQKDHNLGVDGIVGKATWAKLDQLLDMNPSKPNDHNENDGDLSLNVDGEDIGARANITVLDLERDKAIALREEYEAMGYRTEVSYG